MGLRPSVRGSSEEHQRRRMADSVDGVNYESNDSSNRVNRQAERDRTDGDSLAESSTPQDFTSSLSKQTSPPVQRQAWTSRGQLLLKFHDAISRAINSPEMIKKCSEIAEEMDNQDVASTRKSTSLVEDYSAEAILIIENKSRRDAEVRKKTIAMGVCSFGLLRGGRGLSSWMKKMATNANQYRFDSLPSSGIQYFSMAAPKSMQHKPKSSNRFLHLAFDATISTTIALFSGAFLFIPHPSIYINDMAELPLVEGKSLYAEMVCPPILKEYKHVLEKYGRWPVRSSIQTDGKEALTQEDVGLNTIRKFAENCSKRSKYERALLDERSALSNAHDSNPGVELIHRLTRKKFLKENKKEKLIKLGAVMVPSGGVPVEIRVNLDHDVLSLDEEESDVQSDN